MKFVNLPHFVKDIEQSKYFRRFTIFTSLPTSHVPA